MLSQQYLEFGQKARDFYVKHGLMSKAADAWAKKMGTGWEKAPVQVCACVYVRVFARVRVYVRVCECVCAQKRGKTCCCVPVFEEMPLPILALSLASDHAPPSLGRQMLAQVKSAACGNGGPCPAGPAFIRKSGLTSAAEVAWSKVCGPVTVRP